MNDSKARGAIWGIFLADSLALGPHWIYDATEIAQRFGHIDRLQAPATNYHPGKVAGDQTHLGDQALLLLQASDVGYDDTKFMTTWVDFWENLETVSYCDHATNETLANIAAKKSFLEAGSHSSELAGPARGLLLVPNFLVQSRDAAVQSVVSQTQLTHHSDLALQTGEFLAGIVFDLLHGGTLKPALETAIVDFPLLQSQLLEARLHLQADPITAIDMLGQSCALPGALASVLYLALKFENDPVEGLIQNALAGGDSAARGLVLGAIFGAIHGFDVWPESWKQQLRIGPLLP